MRIAHYFLIITSMMVVGVQTKAADICSAILANGTFDRYDSYTSSANFSLVYNTLCKSSVETYQDATSSAGNLGISILDVVDASLGGSTTSANFSQRKSQFCSLNYSNVSNNSTVITKVQVASKVIAGAWETCVSRATRFVAWVTLAKNLDAFTISMRNNSNQGTFQLYQISHPSAPDITCDGDAHRATRANPISYSQREVNIGCRKPATDTVQISADTSAGNLAPVDLPGTVALVSDIQIQLKALQASINILPAGTIIPWYVRSGRIPDGWAVCDGSNGTPDLRGRFLRGTGSMAEVGKADGKDTADISSGNRKGSDFHWGDTPWRDGPNPAIGQSISIVPPHVTVLYLMKL